MIQILEAGFDRPAKNTSRKRIFSDLPPIGSLLTMPSTNRLCVEELRERGVVNDDTRQVWIESERSIARTLEDVANERTEVVRKKLEEYTTDEKFDLINADTMTSFGARQALAMQNLVGNLNEGGVFILWALGWARAAEPVKFREWFQSRLDSDLVWLREDAYNGVTEAIERAGFRDGDLYDGESITTSLVATLALARCALAKYHYRVSMMGAYRDDYSVPMLIVRFDDVRKLDKKPEALPLATDLLEDYNGKYHNPTQEERDIQAMVFAKSSGSHRVALISDGNSPKWVLLSPTDKPLKTSLTIQGIASFYE